MGDQSSSEFHEMAVDGQMEGARKWRPCLCISKLEYAAKNKIEKFNEWKKKNPRYVFCFNVVKLLVEVVSIVSLSYTSYMAHAAIADVKRELVQTQSLLSATKDAIHNASSEMVDMRADLIQTQSLLVTAEHSVSNVSEALEGLGPLLPNGETTLYVFGGDPRFNTSAGLQQALEYVKTKVLFQHVTILLAPGTHTSGPIVVDFAANLVTISGSTLNRDDTVLVFPDLRPGAAVSAILLGGISVQHFTIQTSGPKQDQQCIFLSRMASFTMTNMACVGFANGLYMDGATRAFLQGVSSDGTAYVATNSFALIDSSFFLNISVHYGGFVWATGGTNVTFNSSCTGTVIAGPQSNVRSCGPNNA